MLRQVLLYTLKPSQKRTIDDVKAALAKLKKGHEAIPNIRGHVIGLSEDPLKDPVSIIAFIDYDNFEELMASRQDPGVQEFLSDAMTYLADAKSFPMFISDEPPVS